MATSVACGGAGLTERPPGVDDRTWDEVQAYVVSAEDAAPLVGCYSIQLLHDYGPPMRENGSPWIDPPEGYPGLPDQVVLDTTRAVWGGLVLEGRTPGFGDWERWGLIEVRADSVFAGWAGSLGFWGLSYELKVHDIDLEGVTWYWSDVDFRREPKAVRWARADCM